jgi:hypothetical protein
VVNYPKHFGCFRIWKVRIGDTNHVSDKDDINLAILDIQDIAKHPQYNGITAYFDIAVIETDDVTFSKGVSPVCLPR